MDYILYLLCFLLSWITVRHFLYLLSRNQRKLPPGPTPLPVIGNLLSLGDKPHVSLTRLAQTYGPVMSLQLGRVNTVVISSSTFAKEVMQRQDVSFSFRTVPDSLTACRHHDFSMAWLQPQAEWRNLRKLTNSQVFSSSRLDACSHLRKQKVHDLLSEVESCCGEGVAVNIGQAAFNTTLNLLSNTFFSVDLADQKFSSASNTGFKDLVSQIMIEAGKPNMSDYFPVLKWLDPQGIRGRLGVHFGKMMDLFDGMIDDRLKVAGDRSTDDGSKATGDALDALLKMIQEDSSELGFNRMYLRHLLLDLFAAGTDTTSNTLEWAMTELLRNPTKMKKAQEELQNLIGKDNSVDEKDISKLSYLSAVINETFRVHPPIPFLIPRKVMTNIDFLGFTVPMNSQVLVNVWAIGKDPNVWEDVNSFKPERFVGSKVDVKGLDFELTPFGAGRRICPGMPLAIRMLPMMLASLIHSFDWILEDEVTVENMDMEENFGITLHKAQPLMAIPIKKF